MIPIVTPEEMGAIDRAAPEPVELLIDRAAGAVARAAVSMLGGTYGRRVVVIAGKGNNGNDGRVAADKLRRRGVRVSVLDATAAPDRIPACDLVIDAAYGTGFRGTLRAPEVRDGTPVLAVDIPSGIDGVSGDIDAGSRVLRAQRTVTFAALKPGLLLHPGAGMAGEVDVADIGLDVSRATMHLVEDHDVAVEYPARAVDAHKWQSAAWVIGGSPGLEGAAVLTSMAALRAGAGYVRWSSLGQVPSQYKPLEVVATALPEQQWAPAVVDGAARFAVVTVGNGLGVDADGDEVVELLRGIDKPVVVDADALSVCGTALNGIDRATVVLTPHDGEFERIAGHKPGTDRIAAARGLATSTGTVVLLKGPTTVVAHPDGRTLLSTSGHAGLATLGSGDVLTGVIAAFISRGIEPFRAAALAAHVHGIAGGLAAPDGMVAGDIVDRLPTALARLT